MTGADTLPSPSARCAPVAILVRVQGASSTAVPPPFRRTTEHPTTLRVRTPDIVLRVLNALSYLVILTSNLLRWALLTLKLHHSWTSGCASSLRERQRFRLTVARSIPILPYPVVRSTPHLDHVTVVGETADASQGFVFALARVLASAVTHGARKGTVRVCLSALQVRFLLSD